LKDAINEALRDWVATVETTHYCIGSVMGPHPYPYIGPGNSNAFIGDEARASAMSCSVARIQTSWWPASAVARTRPAPSAGFVDTGARLRRRRGGRWRRHDHGVPGVVHGMRSRFLQDEDGQILEACSVSAGLDYRGCGPRTRLSRSRRQGRVPSAEDSEVLAPSACWPKPKGSSPALEPAAAHALALGGPEKPESRSRRVQRC